MELLLFGSAITFYLMVILLLFALVYCDIQENGYLALIAIIIALGFNYFWGTFPILELFTLRNILIYVFSGFVFSILRTYFKGKELTEEDKKYFRLKDHVFRWWFLFPISAINWIFGELLKDLFSFLYARIEKLYESIFNA